MSSLSRDLVFLVLQFLDEEKYTDSLHRLEQESGFYFNMRYFEEMVTNGQWEDVVKYLSGFTKVEDNPYSMKIFFEIQKQKYLEALHRKDKAAVDFLLNDLKVFAAFSEDFSKEIALLLTLKDFRENEQLSKYGDANSARSIMLGELKKLIEANPVFNDKLTFPSLKNTRLRTLINQSLNWQHHRCENPKSKPDIRTLFVDHFCGPSQPNSAHAPSLVTNPLFGGVPKPAGLPPLGAHAPYQAVPAPMPPNLSGWMTNPSVAHPSASAGSIAIMKRPRTPSADVAEGIRVLKTPEKRTFDPSKVTSSSAVMKSSAMTTSGATANATGGPSIMDRATKIPPIITTSSVNQNLADRPITRDEVTDKHKMYDVKSISEPSHCRFLRLSDNTSSTMRVIRLKYTNAGLSVVALTANAVHKLWKWPTSVEKATASVAPQIWQPTSGIWMTNDISDTSTSDSIACFALSKNDSYLASASGGKISLFNTMTFEPMTTFLPPPPTATFLAFHPRDNNIIAIGMDDSSIQIYNVRLDQVKTKLIASNKRITGLTFSDTLNVLVSSGADGHLCVWSTDEWEKQNCTQLQIPGGRVAARVADTHVQFHQDQKHLLVVHPTKIAIFEAPKLKFLREYEPLFPDGEITHAAYSCDSQTIYVTFEDGHIDIRTASTLRLRCQISSTAYLPSDPESKVYPLVVAAHPSEPNQFALGLTDGGVCVIEPPESDRKWGKLTWC